MSDSHFQTITVSEDSDFGTSLSEITLSSLRGQLDDLVSLCAMMDMEDAGVREWDEEAFREARSSVYEDLNGSNAGFNSMVSSALGSSKSEDSLHDLMLLTSWAINLGATAQANYDRLGFILGLEVSDLRSEEL